MTIKAIIDNNVDYYKAFNSLNVTTYVYFWAKFGLLYIIKKDVNTRRVIQTLKYDNIKTTEMNNKFNYIYLLSLEYIHILSGNI